MDEERIRYLKMEIQEKIYCFDIYEKSKTERNIANLDKARELYSAIDNGDLARAREIARNSLDRAYEKARKNLKELLEFGFSDDIKETYIPKLQRTITNTQKTLFPDLFADSQT